MRQPRSSSVPVRAAVLVVLGLCTVFGGVWTGPLRLSGSHHPASHSQPARLPAATPTGSLAPPMGWNGYNHFSRRVTAAIVEEEASAIVTSGMKAAGYRYVNLDGGWDLLTRDARGDLQPNSAKFPQGIAPVVSYVHSLGLEFGIYTSAGSRNCFGDTAGSFGHYAADARLFASWGIDYVKFDWCHVPYGDFPGLTHSEVSQLLARQMAAALASTNRPIFFDINDTEWKSEAPWQWAPRIGRMWRVDHDIRDSYSGVVGSFLRDVPLSKEARPGAWNDPDMLEVGNGGLSASEEKTQFSLWAELAAPLIAGNDLSSMSEQTRAVLTNASVISVDQDRLGKQGHAVSSVSGHWVLAKELANGNEAVVLFNQSGQPARITTTAVAVGLGKAASYTLRDLWTGDVTQSRGTISDLVPAHGVEMFVISLRDARSS